MSIPKILEGCCFQLISMLRPVNVRDAFPRLIAQGPGKIQFGQTNRDPQNPRRDRPTGSHVE